ncbi:MAG: DUF4296 domain-containing protein [Bacteroidia bacterium]|nr:DUF4296 domain-containing protein [Bacteroidia bacterium]NNJ55348.1 DUF4296 domain-containing protein [Bacteroidia bacterium]
MKHNTRTKILLLWFITLIFACKSKEQRLPDGILSKEEMIEVITDLQMIEAAHKSMTLSSNTQKPMRDTSYTIVFNKHQTNVATFDSSLRVYTRHPAMFSEIMEEVGVRLNSTE